LAGGTLGGRLAFKDSDTGLTMQAKLSLAGVDAAVLLPSGARPPVTGSLNLSAEVEGAGLSPVALVGSLQGGGKIALSDAQMVGLDPRAFDAVTRAVDQGLSIDNARIADVVQKALASGQLSVKRAASDFAIGAGQVRLTKTAIDSQDADLSLTGNVDLTDGSLDARLVLSGSNEAAGARPDIFMALKGPVAAPSRSVDVSALTGWLTLRAIESQAKKLREIEKQREEERQREAERRREEEARSEVERQRETERQHALEAARQQLAPPPSIAAPNSVAAPVPQRAPPMRPKSAPARPASPKTQSTNELAPALPAPVEIKPLSAPGQVGQPVGSFGPQN
jgi:large subunit ribosomal protein L24